MQVIYKNKDEGSNSTGADSVGVILCAERFSRCIKREYIGGLKREVVEI